jgi:hypothetical protein
MDGSGFVLSAVRTYYYPYIIRAIAGQKAAGRIGIIIIIIIRT